MCRLLPRSRGLPRFAGGSASTTSLSRCYGAGGDSETVVAVTRRSKMPQPNDLATKRSATPSAGTRRPVSLRSRAQRWRDAVAELAALQNECDAWLQSLPDSLQQSATAEALQAICDLDIGDLQAIEPPRGFGRD